MKIVEGIKIIVRNWFVFSKSFQMKGFQTNLCVFVTSKKSDKNSKSTTTDCVLFALITQNVRKSLFCLHPAVLKNKQGKKMKCKWKFMIRVNTRKKRLSGNLQELIFLWSTDFPIKTKKLKKNYINLILQALQKKNETRNNFASNQLVLNKLC